MYLPRRSPHNRHIDHYYYCNSITFPIFKSYLVIYSFIIYIITTVVLIFQTWTDLHPLRLSSPDRSIFTLDLFFTLTITDTDLTSG